ncbi:hypothetical protein A2U01_0007087 [Trifolium medium]|uniref:Uncharacterized protein n=1 Tax=Trifolium medium TaxID=97028 RepID=A0A392MGB5_9FABA|nr:hypothetical protein [Trifolium medium]
MMNINAHQDYPSVFRQPLMAHQCPSMVLAYWGLYILLSCRGQRYKRPFAFIRMEQNTTGLGRL